MSPSTDSSSDEEEDEDELLSGRFLLRSTEVFTAAISRIPCFDVLSKVGALLRYLKKGNAELTSNQAHKFMGTTARC